MKINVDELDIDYGIAPKRNKEPSMPISNLLSNKNTTIEDLLNYENLFDELESKNSELLKYFTKDKIKILIDYMIKEPEKDDYEKINKYAFTCCEIFKLKIEHILNLFFIDDNDDSLCLLDELFSFIDNNKENNKELNTVLCGYFTSAIDILLNYNPNSFLKYIYLRRKDVLFLMSKCYNNSIMEILGQILFFEKYDINDDIKVNIKIFNEIRNNILEYLFKDINISMDNEKLISMYYFINKFFQKDNIQKLKEIFEKIIDDECIINNLIYDNLYNLDLINYSEKEIESLENKRKNFLIIIDIIIILLKNIDFLQLEKPKKEKQAKIKIIHTKISQNIFDILEDLIYSNFNKRNPHEKKFVQSFNESSIPPLGEYKIKIIEFISYLIPYFSNISKIFDGILIHTGFFKFVFDYIFEYEWNNLYQEEVLNLMKKIIFKSPIKHKLLINYLVKELKLFELIKNHLLESNKFKYSNSISNNISRGYFSFLINLCYIINSAMEESNSRSDTDATFEFRKNRIYIERENINEINFNNGISINFNHKAKFNDVNVAIDKKANKKNNHNYLKKFLNDDWKLFYNNNVYNIIKQYDNKKWPNINEEKESMFNFLNYPDEYDEINKFNPINTFYDFDENIHSDFNTKDSSEQFINTI